jgi:hypothetical protein
MDRSFWLRQFQRWHWISAAVCLVGMLLFAATGITLNHAASLDTRPVVTTLTGTMPPGLLQSVAATTKGPLPRPLRDWLKRDLHLSVDARAAEWSKREIYVSLPRAGGDAWMSIDRATGAVEYELTDRGWISYLNDLHKGRNTGALWSLFLDTFAIGCLVFCVTGLLLLQMHAWRRPATWPVVGLGIAIPVVILLLFVH